MRRPIGRALGASAAVHGALAGILLAFLATQTERVATEVPPPRTNLVYIARTNTGQMTGGGGHRAERPPTELTIPPPRPVTIATTSAVIAIDPPPTLTAPVQTDLASVLTGTGLSPLALPGPGGRGDGGGTGPGKGPGAGLGDGGDTGGGQRGGGGTVMAPVLLRHVRPEYTNDALRARIQGSVVLEALVLANGTVGRVTVTKSLRPDLDQQAILAARQWLFQPGRQNGNPVDTIVTLILEFRLH